VIDPAGNAVILFAQTAPAVAHTDLWANRFVPGIGWGTAEPVETFPGNVHWSYDLAIGSDGTALAIWPQRAGATDRLLTARFQ
jgi:hypothetical protein